MQDSEGNIEKDNGPCNFHHVFVLKPIVVSPSLLGQQPAVPVSTELAEGKGFGGREIERCQGISRADSSITTPTFLDTCSPARAEARQIFGWGG
jgi:hypothetical protein